jgi:hypothetical protein
MGEEDGSSLAQKGEDTSNIIQFNCPDVLDFTEGSTVLPLRITCYCRHHREKVGFRVSFTLHDEAGRVVGAGTTPPIMITDDHKTGTGTRKKAVDAGAGGREAGGARVRAKPYEYGRPDSRKTSVTGSPASVVPSLPMTRAASPAALDTSMWLPTAGTLVPTEWNTMTGVAPVTAAAFSGPSILEHQTTPTTTQSAAQLTSPVALATPLAFFPPAGPSALMPVQAPVIHRLVPAKGPTSGGTEVTVLGAHFPASGEIKCVFGDVAATATQRWSDNTLVCVVPPRLTPGVVPVWIEGVPMQAGPTPPHYTYEDESDRAL